jgi:hypothetical protein
MTTEELARRNPSVLARIVEHDKTRLLHAIDDLKRSARNALSPGTRLAPRAWLWLATGVAIGFVLGSRR